MVCYSFHRSVRIRQFSNALVNGGYVELNRMKFINFWLEGCRLDPADTVWTLFISNNETANTTRKMVPLFIFPPRFV